MIWESIIYNGLGTKQLFPELKIMNVLDTLRKPFKILPNVPEDTM